MMVSMGWVNLLEWGISTKALPCILLYDKYVDCLLIVFNSFDSMNENSEIYVKSKKICATTSDCEQPILEFA